MDLREIRSCNLTGYHGYCTLRFQASTVSEKSESHPGCHHGHDACHGYRLPTKRTTESLLTAPPDGRNLIRRKMLGFLCAQFVNEVTDVFGLKHEYFVNWPVYSSLVIFSNRHFSLLLFQICADGSTHIQAVLFCTHYGLTSMLSTI